MSEPVLAVMVPQKLSHRIWPFSRADKWFGLCAMLVVLVVLSWYGEAAAFLTFVVGGLCLIRTNNGRPYYNFGQWCYSYWLRSPPRHGVIWNRGDVSVVEGGDQSFDSEASAKPSRPRHRQLLTAKDGGPIPLELHEIGAIGLIYNRTDKTDSIVISADGSNIVSLDLEGQAAAHTAMAETIKRVASTRGYVVHVSFVYRRRPPNIWLETANYMRNLHPDVLLPEALVSSSETLTADQQRAERIHGNLMEVRDQVLPAVGAEVTMAMVLSIRRSHTLAASKGSLAEDEVNRLPIIEMANAAQDGLVNAGVVNPRVMTPADVRQFLRETWDVATLGTYYQQRADGTADPAMELQWPQREIRVENDLSVFDTTGHTVLRVTRIRQPALFPHFMRMLYSVNASWVTITLVGSALRSTGDEFALGKMIDLADTLQEIRGGTRERARQRNRREAMEDREEDLANSDFIATYNILIDVAGDDSQQLKRDAQEVRRLAEYMGLTVQVITGESRQTAAVWSTAGINML